MLTLTVRDDSLKLKAINSWYLSTVKKHLLPGHKVEVWNIEENNHYFQHEPVIYKEEGELQETGCSSCMSHSGLWRSSDRFRVYSRLSNERFNKHSAGESWTGICRDRSNFWEAISPKKRSAIFLRWVIYVKIKCEKQTLLLSLFRIKQCI